ncbi:hypothetical protein EPR50_G00091910 [Perca flavescens]|uniref:TAFA chemokine like family member 5 n=1 Tax=Perca flavescens TaxID=8167 RepID=A0A484D370_PERFV|nr:hypothetical protein EPR50_G00091910 [Perca flavescens]
MTPVSQSESNVLFLWLLCYHFCKVLEVNRWGQLTDRKHLAASQLAAGTCEVVTLDRDSSQPRRTIARQTARCACRKGQIAGTTRARPACVDGKMLAVLCRQQQVL